MITISLLFAAVAAAVTFARDTSIGAMLHRALIEKPADWLNNAGPIRLLALIIVGLAILAAPEITLFVAADLTLYCEVLTAAVLIAGQVRLRVVVARAKLVLQRPVTVAVAGLRRLAARALRLHRPDRGARRPSNDPDGWAFA